MVLEAYLRVAPRQTAKRRDLHARAIRKIAPGPTTPALLGQLLQVRRDRLEFIQRITQQFGDVVRFRMGPRILHLINHPDHIHYVLNTNAKNYQKGVGLTQAKRWLGDGLVTSEGETWSRQRRQIEPLFQRQQLAPFAAIVIEEAKKMLQRWRSCAEDRQDFDAASQMMQLTLAVIARAIFGTTISNSNEIEAAFTTALRDVMERMTALITLPNWIPMPGRRRFKSALHTLNTVASRIIEEHRNARGTRADLISMLLAERDEGNISDKEIRDQVLTFLLAGHETTASSLAWSLFLASKQAGIWEQMTNEVDRTLAGRPPTNDDLPRLSYIRMVLDETLRLYPSVWMVSRLALNDDEIAGYFIPANSDVLISPFLVHRDPRFWNHPDNFDPARFRRENRQKQHRLAYLPFGFGPRACIGSSFAVVEAVLVLAMVAQNFRLRVSPDWPILPEPLLTLRVRHGVRVMPILRNR